MVRLPENERGRRPGGLLCGPPAADHDRFESKPPFQVSASHFRSAPSMDIIRPVRLVRLAQEAKDRENCNDNIAQRQSTFCLTNDDGKLPDGQISKTCPALRAKIFRLTRRANHLYKFAPSHPDEGRIASRHERAVGCDGRDSVGRAGGRRAGLAVSDRTARGRTMLPTVLPELAACTRRGRIFGVDGRGRRSRVVLAPRCWRQVWRRCIRPNRVRDVSSIRKATVANKPVTGESAK
jgi:hypothetical protein